MGPIWLDAQLPPALAPWLTVMFGHQAYSLRFLGLDRASDETLFFQAREAKAVVMTKDADFPRLLSLHGPPPLVLWLTLGNTSNANLRRILSANLTDAMALLQSGEPLVEITDPPA